MVAEQWVFVGFAALDLGGWPATENRRLSSDACNSGGAAVARALGVCIHRAVARGEQGQHEVGKQGRVVAAGELQPDREISGVVESGIWDEVGHGEAQESTGEGPLAPCRPAGVDGPWSGDTRARIGKFGP